MGKGWVNRRNKKILIIASSTVILFAISQPAAAQAAEKPGSAPHLMHAESLLREGKLPQAEKALKTYISSSSPEADAYNLLGMIYDAEKHFDKAAQAYQQAIELDPSGASPHINLGVNCLRRGRSGAATQEFLTALRLDPNNEVAASDLAELSLERNHYSEAIKYFELARKLRPADSVVLLGLAKAYFSLGSQRKALETARALSNLSSVGPRFHFSLGVLLAQHGVYSQAVIEFQKVVADGVESHDVFLSLGLAFSHLKEYDKAKENYFNAIQCNPKDYMPYLRVGADYLAQKKVPLAIAWLRRAFQISPCQLEALYLLGTALDQGKYYKTAQKYLREYVQRRPEDSKGWALLGDAYLNDDMQYQKALECYRRTQALVPNLASANYLVGYASYLLRQLPEAKKYLLKALNLDPTYLEAHLRLGEIAYIEGNDREVKKQLLPLSGNQIEGGQIPYILAKACVRQGQFADARVMLLDLTARYPQNPRYHYALAQLYQKTGHNQQSQEQLNLYKATERDEALQRKLDVDSYISVE